MSNKEKFISDLNENSSNEFFNFYRELINIDISENYKLEERYYSNITSSEIFSYSVSFCDLSKSDREVLEETFKKIQVSGDIFSKGYRINVDLNKRLDSESKYIAINFIKYNRLYFDKVSSHLSETKEKCSIIINDNLTIFSNVFRGKLIPLTFTSLSVILSSFNNDIFSNMIENLFEILSKKNILFRELKEEYFKQHIFLPIKIHDIYNYYNKRDLIQAYLKRELVPKNINKFSLQKGYLLMKCRRYVRENEFQKLYILKDMEFKPSSTGIKDMVIDFMTTYYESVIDLKEYEEEYDSLIEDYIKMSLMSKNKILNVRITSLKRLIDEHDKISIELRQKQTKTIKVPKNSKFNKLKLGSDFEEIKTKKRIVEESIIQKNCVWSYAEDINKDKCRIYSTIFDKKRYTLEIRKRKNKYILNQLRGICNSEAPNELKEKIKEILNKNSR